MDDATRAIVAMLERLNRVNRPTARQLDEAIAALRAAIERKAAKRG